MISVVQIFFFFTSALQRIYGICEMLISQYNDRFNFFIHSNGTNYKYLAISSQLANREKGASL